MALIRHLDAGPAIIYGTSNGAAAGVYIAAEAPDLVRGLLPAARADLLRRLGRHREAAASYSEALDLARNDAERRFLARRLAEAEAAS